MIKTAISYLFVITTLFAPTIHAAPDITDPLVMDAVVREMQAHKTGIQTILTTRYGLPDGERAFATLMEFVLDVRNARRFYAIDHAEIIEKPWAPLYLTLRYKYPQENAEAQRVYLYFSAWMVPQLIELNVDPKYLKALADYWSRKGMDARLTTPLLRKIMSSTTNDEEYRSAFTGVIRQYDKNVEEAKKVAARLILQFMDRITDQPSTISLLFLDAYQMGKVKGDTLMSELTDQMIRQGNLSENQMEAIAAWFPTCDNSSMTERGARVSAEKVDHFRAAAIVLSELRRFQMIALAERHKGFKDVLDALEGRSRIGLVTAYEFESTRFQCRAQIAGLFHALPTYAPDLPRPPEQRPWNVGDGNLEQPGRRFLLDDSNLDGPDLLG